MERHLTPADLDALHLDVASPARRAALTAHAERCATCAEARAQHRAAAREFVEVVAPRTLPRVRRRLAAAGEWRRGGRSVWLWSVTLVAGAAAVGLWARPAPPGRQLAGPGAGAPSAPAGDLGIKGGGALHVFAKRDGRVFEVSDGTVLAPGDAIRFFIDPSGLDHVILGSIDGAGKASIYYPQDGARSARIDPARRVEVPNSIVLDRAPGPERLFAVFSRAPMETEELRAALVKLGARGREAIRQTRDLPLEATLQASLRFEKTDVR